MVYVSLIIIIMAVISVSAMVVLSSISNSKLSKLSIKQRIKIDNISLMVFGILTVIFIIGILSSFHVFDRTYFDNRYDYRYRYETSEGELFSGEFDEYKNVSKINLDDTNLYIMAFRERDTIGLPINVYYKIKVDSKTDYNYEVLCNGTTYMKIYSSSTGLHVMNNDELSLFCNEGDSIQVKLINSNTTMYEQVEFEYSMAFEGFKTIPNIRSINELYPLVMIFVFILFLFLIYKKVNFVIINKKYPGISRPIISKIVMVLITIIVLITMIVLADHDDMLNNTNRLNENDVYLQQKIESEYGDIDIKYNYMTDTLYFRTDNIQTGLDLLFDEVRYVSLKDTNFETLSDITEGWYIIENTENYNNLKIIIYDDNTIVFSEEVSLLHPYYEWYLS